MTVVESRSQTWIRGAQRARVVLLGARLDDRIVVARDKPHRFGDRRYVAYADAHDEDGRAIAFRLVCSPPPPPVRAQSHTSERLRAARTKLLAPLEEPTLGAYDVELYHPYIIVSGIESLDDETIPWCRLEQNALTGSAPRWVDVVSRRAWPGYRKLVERHYGRFYERCRAVRA
jgi:hypothetical protein